MSAATVKQTKPLTKGNNPTDLLDLLRLSCDEIKVYLDRPLHDQMELTDFAARLNALNNTLEKLTKQAKQEIEANLTRDGKTISEGTHFFALLTKLVVTRLNTEKVKEFLGRKLGEYQNESHETRISFKIKG